MHVYLSEKCEGFSWLVSKLTFYIKTKGFVQGSATFELLKLTKSNMRIILCYHKQHEKTVLDYRVSF